MTKGALLILSAPPAIVKSASFDLIILDALVIASIPDAHNLLSVIPGTVCGRFAKRSAILAMLRLSSPAWFALPKKTSSKLSQSALAKFSFSAIKGSEARSSVLIEDRLPPNRPIGVLVPSQIKASDIKNLQN